MKNRKKREVEVPLGKGSRGSGLVSQRGGAEGWSQGASLSKARTMLVRGITLAP